MKEETFLKELLKPKDTIVFACSGGPDSMCLLDLLLKQKEEKELTLICAHINHKQRKESEQEYLFVKEYCEKRNIFFEGIEFSTYKQKNFHAEAHQKRKLFFEKIIEKYKAPYFMTAHHGDDLIETILMRLTRGSSIKGYAGFKQIQKQKNYTLVRPLMTATKEEIERYNKKNKIPYVIDQTNFQDKYTRNRYRHHVIPFLKQENASVHLKYFQFHEKMCQINEFLVKIVENALTDCIRDDNLLIVEFKKLDSFLQEQVIREYLSQIYQSEIIKMKDIHVKKILEFILSDKNYGTISLPKNKIARKNYEIFKIEEKNIQKSFFIELKTKCIINHATLEKVESSEEKNNNTIRLLSSEIELPLYIRNRKDGDYIFAKNLKGRQKLKKIFIDKKIAEELRNNWPILVDAKDTILWVPGLKKSKFDKEINEKYDIIYKYVLSKEKDYVTKK